MSMGKTCGSNTRWAHGHYDRLPALAAELVRPRRGGDRGRLAAGPSALAAKAATSTIPILFNQSVRSGRLRLVASLNRPGGNITGSDLDITLAGNSSDCCRSSSPRPP